MPSQLSTPDCHTCGVTDAGSVDRGSVSGNQPMYAEDQELACGFAAHDEGSCVMNYNTYQHPLFFLFSGRGLAASGASQLRHAPRATGDDDDGDDAWVLNGETEEEEHTPISSPVATPGLTITTAHSRADRTSACHRCRCTSCQRCLPSCFDDLKEEALCGDDDAQGKGGFSSVGRGVDRTSVLLYEMRNEEVRWRPALLRYKLDSAGTVAHHSTCSGSMEFASVDDSISPPEVPIAGAAATSTRSMGAESSEHGSIDTATRRGVVARTDGERQPSARFGHTAVLAEDNNTMIVFAGKNVSHYLNDVHFFDIARGRWTRQLRESECEGQPWPAPRSGHTATQYEGSMYVLSGGINDSNGCADDLWRLHIRSGVWTKECQRLPFSPRKGHTMHLLPATSTSGRSCMDMLVVFGGLVRISRHHPRPGDPEFARTASSSARNEVLCVPTNEVWLYQLSLGRWALLKTSGEAPAPRFYHVSQMLDGTTLLLVFGGRTTASAAANSTATTPAPASGDTEAHRTEAASPVSTSAGGSGAASFTGSASTTCFNDLYILEVSTGVWRPVSGVFGDIPSPRTCCASVFANGIFAVFAGGSAELSDCTYELNVLTRRWSRVKVRNEPACSRPTVVFTGDRLVFYGGCAGANKILGRGRNGVLELPLRGLKIRDRCDLWIRRAAFSELFLASTKKCRAMANAHPGSNDCGPRFPSQNFAKCWSCSPSTSPQQQQQQQPRQSLTTTVQSAAINTSVSSARSGVTISNPPQTTPPPRVSFEGYRMHVPPSPQPFSPATMAAMELAGVPPMSPTEPLPSSRGSFLNASPPQSRPNASRPERWTLPGVPYERSASTSPASTTRPPGSSFEERLPQQQQPTFPRYPVASATPQHGCGVGAASPPVPLAGGPPGAGLRVWIPPHSSPRGSNLPSPQSLVVGSHNTSVAFGAAQTPHTLQTAPSSFRRPPQQQQHQYSCSSQHTSPSARPAAPPPFPHARRPSPPVMVRQTPSPQELPGRRYVPVVEMDGGGVRRSLPTSPLFRDATTPFTGRYARSPRPQSYSSPRATPLETRRDMEEAVPSAPWATSTVRARLEELRGERGPFLLRQIYGILGKDSFPLGVACPEDDCSM